MRTAKNWVFVVCLLAAAGCAAPDVEEDASSDSALKTGSSSTSPIATGLYADGNHNYLRAFPEFGSLSDRALATQRVQWAFEGARGSGVADVTSGRVDVTSTCENCGSSSLRVAKSRTGLDVQVVGDAGTPFQLALHAVPYSSLNGRFRPSRKAASDFVVTMANATSEGIDVTVTGNDTRSTQHLTWEKDDYFSAESTKCGGLHFQQNQLDMRMITPAVGDACAAFSALYQANEGYRAILE